MSKYIVLERTINTFGTQMITNINGGLVCVSFALMLWSSTSKTQNGFISAHREHTKFGWTHTSTNLLGSYQSCLINKVTKIVCVTLSTIFEQLVLPWTCQNELFLTFMLVFMVNNDANGANLSNMVSPVSFLQCRQWKMVKSQNQNVHIWNPNVDTSMIFTSRHMLASLSVMKTHTGLENSLF